MGAWRCLEERQVDEHDDDHAEHGPPRGAALAASALPTPLLSLSAAEEQPESRQQHKFNHDKDPCNTVVPPRGRSWPLPLPDGGAQARGESRGDNQ